MKSNYINITFKKKKLLKREREQMTRIVSQNQEQARQEDKLKSVMDEKKT